MRIAVERKIKGIYAAHTQRNTVALWQHTYSRCCSAKLKWRTRAAEHSRRSHTTDDPTTDDGD